MSKTSAPGFLRADDGDFESAPGRAINARYLADEKTVVSEMLALARLPDAERESIRQDAVALVVAARARREGKTGIESFLQQYGLASQEGVVLMCLAEALLRIPDADTADKLIADKIAIGQWSDYLGEADSLFVNASTWGLMLTGKLVRESELEVRDPVSFLRRLVARLGEPVVRTAFRHAMRIMGRQFVMGRNIGEALERAESDEGERYRHTYDMLGESALTEGMRRVTSRPTARRSRRSGARCARAARPPAGRASRSSCRRCTRATNTGARARSSRELGPRLEKLALAAKSAGIALTVDAEEAERLELSLQLLDRLLEVARARRLGRARPRRAGLFEARAGRAALPAAARRRDLARAEPAAGQGRLLGQRGQARAGTRAARIPGLHAQGQYRRRLPRLRAHPARGHAPHLSAVRDAQRAHGGLDHPPRAGKWPRVRVPAPARDGRGALRGAHRPGRPRAAVPRVCAGRLARGTAAVPGPPPARERRQHVVRQPHRGRVIAGRRTWSATRSPTSSTRPAARTRAYRCRAGCSGPSGATPPASTCRMAARSAGSPPVAAKPSRAP